VKASGKKIQLPQLGLVCITTTDAVRYRTITRKRLLLLETSEQKRVLRELYADNLARLNRAIDFCNERGLRLYRLTSALFPFADDPAGEDVLDAMFEDIKQTGERASVSGLRLVLHPDQFVVLSSDSQQVVANSLKILATHAKVMDYLAQPRSSWAVMNIHGGKGDRSEQLIKAIDALPDAIRSRLTLENDEYTYSAQEILEVCRRAKVPMVFDAHHHVCHEALTSYEDPSVSEMLFAARETWPVPEWQLVHISNGESHFGDRRHSQLVTVMPEVFRYAPWIEVEAKHKELAIEKLTTDWLASLSKNKRTLRQSSLTG